MGKSFIVYVIRKDNSGISRFDISVNQRFGIGMSASAYGRSVRVQFKFEHFYFSLLEREFSHSPHKYMFLSPSSSFSFGTFLTPLDVSKVRGPLNPI